MKLKILLLLVIFYSNLSIAQTNPCTSYTNFRIVVLGSSTAAGGGASEADSAWVNRYRAYMQSLNPANEVINLAVGGYNSYKIMPTGYIPPVGRPDYDSLHNITQAINYLPDAIIINLPSNDIANGYSLNEQLHNLDTILEIATLNNIPLWITTTQARNMSIANMQLQEDMKDSMYVHYSPYIIDFWTGLAMPDNSLNPIYDSGGGIHLNDAGHALLCSRVINTNIPDSLYKVSNIADYIALDIHNIQQNACGDSITYSEIVFANLGTNDTNNINIYFKIENTQNSTSYCDTIQILNGINTCKTDTIVFQYSSYQKGLYNISSYVNYPIDTINTNDTIYSSIYSLGHPTAISTTDDTICQIGAGNLAVETSLNDHVFWYEYLSSTNSISSGNQFTTPVISNTQNWYAEIVRGSLFYKDSITTLNYSNVNWNGCMFNIIPNINMTIDSFNVKIHSTGTQGVEIYKRNGTYKNLESNSFAWDLLGRDTVNVLDENNFTTVNVGQLNISAGDTTAFYIQLLNPYATLSYYNAGTEKTYSNTNLTIMLGSGVSHDFSSTYFPRIWNGEIFYHYGNRPNGDCLSERYSLTAFVHNNNFSIGNDTIINIQDSISISGPNGYTSYLWSNGSTQQNLVLHADNLGYGIHTITLSASDTIGCVFTDTLMLGVTDLFGLEISIYPNPFMEHFFITGIRNETQLQVKNILGENIAIVIKKQANAFIVTLREDAKKGVYIIVIDDESGNIKTFPIIKI